MAEPGSFPDEEAEIDAFVARLKSGKAAGASPPWFAPAEPFVVARAPGRLDVMGGFADYSGSLVLQRPIREAALAAAQHDPTPGLRVVSLAHDGVPPRSLAIDGDTLDRFLSEGVDAARAWFAERPDDHWGAYVAGVVVVLAREAGATPGRGLRIVIDSRVPEGKGASSSAALEVAAMSAVAGLLDAPLSGETIALLCQKAENRVVGAACGIMDQMTAAVGRSGKLLALLCQPAEVQGFIRPPESIGFWGIDSGVRHAVSGSDYTSVRVGTFMGYRILADHQGFPTAGPNRDGLMWVEDGRWSGRLANIDRDEFTQRLHHLLPETMKGAAFLARYGGTTDPAARVDPGRTYEVRQPAAHAVHEHSRALRFAGLMEDEPDEAAFRELGEMMCMSHYGYTMCRLGCDATDMLAEMVAAAGPAKGLYGARITGGGSGGTVAVLGRADARAAVERIARDYEAYTGRRARVFSGSSSGAEALGVRRVPG
jgi:L-arabinokinase